MDMAPQTEVTLPIFHSGQVHVMTAMCSTCVFRPGNLMELRRGRLKDLVDENLKNDAALPCHATVYGMHGLEGQKAVCRGFFERYANDVTALRIARLMRMIKEIS